MSDVNITIDDLDEATLENLSDNKGDDENVE